MRSNIRENNPCRLEGAYDTKPCSVARIMWQADEAWRASLRGVSLADLGAEVDEVVSEDQRRKNFD